MISRRIINKILIFYIKCIKMIDEKEQEQENTIETPLPNDELLELEEKSKLNKKLNKKIISRCLIFILCSLLYLLILVVRISGSGHDMQKQFIHSFVNAIMYVSFAVSIICVIFLLLLSFSNKIREKIDKVKLKPRRVSPVETVRIQLT